MTKITSDGTTASYYQLPEGATELQHLISHRNLNAQDGEIFRAIYRKGRASHSDELRDAKKVLFYAQAEVERLEKLRKPIIRELYTEADENRMDVVGQNGNTAEHYPADEWIPNNGKKPDLPDGAYRHEMTPNYLEYPDRPTFDESADMDPCMLRGSHE